jgi:hypothetical protein
MRKKRKSNANAQKQEITLMTLLANEATSDARKLLKKHGITDVKNHVDLEVKLAELYFNSPDKIAIEKEMAAIHPHKNWITKYSEPKVEVKKEETTVDLKTTDSGKSEVKKDSAPMVEIPTQGVCPSNCPLHHSMNPHNPYFAHNRVLSNFMGTGNESNRTNENERKTQSPMDYMGMIGLVAVVGISFYVISKSVK